MTSLKVVKAVDEFCDGARGSSARRKGLVVGVLAFQSREKALGDRVVPAVATAAHTDDEAVSSKLRPIVVTRVGAPSVRMMNCARWWASRAMTCVPLSDDDRQGMVDDVEEIEEFVLLTRRLLDLLA